MKFKTNVHAPRVTEQKYTTLTVNIKEIESYDIGKEIKSKLDSIIPGIIRDAAGQLTIDKKEDKQNAKLDQPTKGQKVARKARASKKADKDVGA